MKHILFVLISFVLVLHSLDARRVHKLKSHRYKNGSSNSTTTSNRPNVTTVNFSDPATNFSPNINSVGEKIDSDVTLTQFPFKISRCDQVLFFPVAYINNDNDYRVRKAGYFVLTALYANLYFDKDAQKLIEHIVLTQTSLLPQYVTGADGCVRIGADKGQKDMLICLQTKANAQNLLQVFEDFTRCRLGDNLTEISKENLQFLIGLCNVDQKQLLQSQGPARNVQAGGISNSQVMAQKQDQENMLRLAKNRLHKSKKPEFDFPSEHDNKWEKERLKYFMPSSLRVPGQKPVEKKLPVGLQPGSVPMDNPLLAPVSMAENPPTLATTA